MAWQSLRFCSEHPVRSALQETPEAAADRSDMRGRPALPIESRTSSDLDVDSPGAALVALSLLARLHHVAADPGQPAHRLGCHPTIEPLAAFAELWAGELVLSASQASLAGALARIDFSWFVLSLVADGRVHDYHQLHGK